MCLSFKFFCLFSVHEMSFIMKSFIFENTRFISYYLNTQIISKFCKLLTIIWKIQGSKQISFGKFNISETILRFRIIDYLQVLIRLFQTYSSLSQWTTCSAGCYWNYKPQLSHFETKGVIILNIFSLFYNYIFKFWLSL